MSETNTVRDLFNMLESYGISGSVDSSGKVTLQSTNGRSISGDLVTLFDLNKSETVQSGTVNTKSNTLLTTSTVSATLTTKLADLANGSYQDGFITIVKNGAETNISLSADETIGSLMEKLRAQGFSTSFTNGQLTVSANSDIKLKKYTGTSQASNALELLGIDEANWKDTSTYKAGSAEITTIYTSTTSVEGTTQLGELGITDGYFYIYNNGVRYKAMVSSTDTFNDLRETLARFGVQSGLININGETRFVLTGNGESYMESVPNSSNIVDVLFPNGIETTYDYSANLQTSVTTKHTITAEKDVLLSEFDTDWGTSTLTSAGTLSLTIDGQNHTITIGTDETFGSLMQKFEELGINASLANGKLTLSAGSKDFTINQTGSSSNLINNLGLTYSDDLGGYMSSDSIVEATTTTIVEETGSVANSADYSTKLGLVNISSGTFSIYRDGQKAVIQIDEDDTFADLRSKISSVFSDVDLKFENGMLQIYSKTEGVEINASASSDSSNITAVLGLTSTDGMVTASREIYRVSGDSLLTESGLFRKGDVTEGTFTIGDATFEITSTTTLNDIISQINASEKSNASAYWDSVDGKLVIESRTSGAALINIESGTSNFTDIMGYTSTDSSGIKRLNSGAQEIGSNAKFSINGTNYTSTSNTVTSDISRIKGVTLNLKKISEEGESVTLTIEKDSEKLMDAISEIVDSYNELIENVDKEIASDGQLKDQTMLKLIRNQLRNLMTGSSYGNSVFKNLDAIGIDFDSASANDISTENVNKLFFDEDKFLEAYTEDSEALKDLLIGTEDNPGIFIRVEDIVESSLKSVTGYFDSADKSYADEIERYDTKIERANKAVERYRARLEAKFQSMDMLIANMQNQYSSFLSL